MNDENESPKSALRIFLDEIIDSNNEFIHTELETLQKTILNFLCTSKGVIREHDRRKMILTVNQITKLEKLQQYIYNSLLIYEGQGVVGMLER
jgi:hypothetical protein